MKRLNLKGRQFNTFLILQEIEPHVEPSGRKRRRYLCLCKCGNKFKSLQTPLLSGSTKSCGCFRKKKLQSLATKHGLSKVYPKEYRAWCLMRHRHKGEISDAWLRFDVFMADMGVGQIKASLRRSNRKKMFSKDNCYWLQHSSTKG